MSFSKIREEEGKEGANPSSTHNKRSWVTRVQKLFLPLVTMSFTILSVYGHVPRKRKCPTFSPNRNHMQTTIDISPTFGTADANNREEKKVRASKSDFRQDPSTASGKGKKGDGLP
ncbi:hypothetical protein CDAR_420311 [Caerostris darwini]|uniref:Transmembrane protein n=1 Tax=Caerostris darwini TaxID=1538125 RepID=A0AAV4TTE8_9ARAC|nr:hypothetical protein CDAR_420311 [Caerostris darwini]